MSVEFLGAMHREMAWRIRRETTYQSGAGISLGGRVTCGPLRPLLWAAPRDQREGPWWRLSTVSPVGRGCRVGACHWRISVSGRPRVAAGRTDAVGAWAATLQRETVRDVSEVSRTVTFSPVIFMGPLLSSVPVAFIASGFLFENRSGLAMGMSTRH